MIAEKFLISSLRFLIMTQVSVKSSILSQKGCQGFHIMATKIYQIWEFCFLDIKFCFACSESFLCYDLRNRKKKLGKFQNWIEK